MTKAYILTDWLWDPLLRIFKWSFALLFLLAFLTEGEPKTLHYFAGFALLGLVLFRLVWGVIGTPNSLWWQFLTGWGAVKQHAIELIRLQPHSHQGHDPIGGWMIVLMLLMISLTSVTGVLLIASEGVGPLAGRVTVPAKLIEEIHEWLANVSMLLVVVHVIGVVAVSLINNTNLIRSMWTGKAPESNDVPSEHDHKLYYIALHYLRYVMGVVLLLLAIVLGVYGASLA